MPTDATVVSLVMGERSPQICGVSDYATQLYQALEETSEVLPHLHAVNARTGNADAGAVLEALRSIAADHPDIVHFQYPGLAYNRRVIALLLPALVHLRRRRSRPRIVVTFHESANPTRSWELRYGAALMAADAVIRVAETVELSPWQWRLAAGKPQLTVPIASTVAVDSGPAMRRDALFSIPVSRVFISFGLVIREKRIEEMLDWVAAHDEVGLLIVGGQRPEDPYPAELAAQITRQGLGQRVLMMGWRDPQAVSALLRVSDAVLVPVVRPQSGAYTAASQHGVPVVTLTPPSERVPGVVPLGALVGPGIDAALLDARQDMERSSRPISWREIACMHVRFYRELLAGRGG